MIPSNSEIAVLNFYRASELHGDSSSARWFGGREIRSCY